MTIQSNEVKAGEGVLAVLLLEKVDGIPSIQKATTIRGKNDLHWRSHRGGVRRGAGLPTRPGTGGGIAQNPQRNQCVRGGG